MSRSTEGWAQSEIQLTNDEVAALRNLFSCGGSLTSRADHLYWEIRHFENVPGTSRGSYAEKEFNNLMSAVQTIVRHL